MEIDPYQILKIPREATLEEVKDAFRLMAKEHHPDKGSNPENFKIMKLAFKLIIDSLKKGVPLKKQTSTTFVEMRSASQNFQEVQKQAEPHEFFGQNRPINPNREFDGNTFNQKFLQN